MKMKSRVGGAAVLPAMLMLLAAFMAAGVAPANINALLVDAANPCIQTSKICFPNDLECPELSCLTMEECDKDYFEFEEDGETYRYWFCLCEDGVAGNAPDPMTQGWDCGIIGKSDENNTPIDKTCTPDSGCPGEEEKCDYEPIAGSNPVCWHCVCN